MKPLSKNLLYFFILSTFFVYCTKNETPVQPTTFTISFTVDAQQSTVNTNISFLGSATIDDANIATWQWDFADGTPVVTTKNVVRKFLLAGSYLVTLTVTNKTGQTANFSTRILIKNTAAPNYGNLIGLKEKLALLQPKIMVAAHRAYQKNYPENSVEAINDAAFNNINIVEIDARLSLDRELVIIHDATTNRTTNGSFTVAQRTLAELKQLRLLFQGVPTSYTIPTLKESLEAAKGKVYVNIDASWDVSPFYYNKIYNTVAALNMLNMVMIYTESADVAKGLLAIDPNVIVLLGAGNATDYNNANSMNPKAAIWHLASATLSPNFTNWPSNNGIKLWANAYVNSSAIPPTTGNDAVVDNLRNNQVSIIQTDYPVELINYLQSRNVWLQ